MQRPLHILVVDDNPQDRHLVVRELRKSHPDARILEAIDQLQLEDHLDNTALDVVVTDLHLQWSDGIQVLKEVKRRTPDCPVIMFTATGNEEVAVEAMKLGLDDYIIKNIRHLVRLRGAVTAALSHARVRRQAKQLSSRLESLLSQFKFGVFTCSMAGQFLETNDAMASLLRCQTRNEANQMTLADLFDEPASAIVFLQQIITSDDPLEAEIEITHPASRWLRLCARRVVHSDQDPLIEGIVEDVSVRKQSEVHQFHAADAAAKIATLSPRELDVWRGVVTGLANKVIARRLEISAKTVEKHRSNLMRKLRVRSVAELVRLATLAESNTG